MTKLVKYPRTMNFPWSDSNSSDDVWWKDSSRFNGKEVVMTEKMDGECTSLYRDHTHARSIDTANHASRTLLKNFHATFAHEIPQDWRIVGENLYAFHSIFYDGLPSYFLVFGIYNEKNQCLSWDETVEFCQLLGLHTVPLIYRGIWNEKEFRAKWEGKGAIPTYSSTSENPVWPETFQPTIAEGYVCRLAEEFAYDDFGECCAKYVRPHHVQSPTNWLLKPVLPNNLRAQDT